MIDGWVVPNIPDSRDNPASGVADRIPGLKERISRGTSPAEMVEMMNRCGIEKAVLVVTLSSKASVQWVEDARAGFPDRFLLSAIIDPRDGMKAMRQVDDCASIGYIAVRLIGVFNQLPYDDAAYFPIYAKCVEKGLLISCNIGLPWIGKPGQCQNPMTLDRVCAFFPEAQIIMSHTPDPWTEDCISLMRRWPNLYWMSTGISPLRLPRPMLDYANADGASRIMLGSDFPIQTIEKCAQAVSETGLKDDARKAAYGGRNFSNALEKAKQA